MQAPFGHMENIDGLIDIQIRPEGAANLWTGNNGLLKSEEKQKAREVSFPGINGFSIEEHKWRCQVGDYTKFFERRYITKFSFCTDIIKIDGEKPAKLFDQVIYRSNTAVEQFGNITWEKIYILNKYTSYWQMDNQIWKKPGRPHGIEFNKLEPCPDIKDMGGVDFYLPVISHTADTRWLKS